MAKLKLLHTRVRVAAVAFATAALLAVAPAWARTVSVSSFNKTTGEAVLSISAAEVGDGPKALVAAWAPTQIGADATGIRESKYVGVVAAAETSKSFTVPAAWLAKSGVVRFFLMADVPPYDARLESMRTPNSSTPYIDTGYVPNVNSDIRVVAAYTNTAEKSVAPFGVSGKCYLFDNTPSSANTTWYYQFFGAGGADGGDFTFAEIGQDRHEYWLNAAGVHIDGLCKIAFDPASLTDTTTLTLTLFGRRESATSTGKRGVCTIWSAQIRENGTLLHDYVPCLTNGVAILYDRKTGSFPTKLSSGNFVAGEEIGPEPEDCGGVESASDAIVLAPSMAASVVNRGVVEISLKGAHGAGVIYWVGGDSDAGETLSGWQATNFLCKVAAGVQTVTTNIPPESMRGGKRVRFLWRSAEDVPYDYEVESLRSAGAVRVNSDVVPNMQTAVAVRGKVTAENAMFGLSTCLFMYRGWSGVPRCCFFTPSSADEFELNDDLFHTIEIDAAGSSMDGVSKTHAETPTFTQPNYPMWFFARKTNDSSGFDKAGDCTIQWAKISESGRLVRDLVPCVADGEACFYDKVSRSYLKSTVATKPEAGNIVANLTDADALVWSNSPRLGFVLTFR